MVVRARSFQIVFQFGLAAPCVVRIGQFFCIHTHEVESGTFGACYAP
jgi:hypothetical protein